MSSPLRIELRRSRWLPLALCALAALAGWALWLSAAPRATLLGVPVLLLAAWPRRAALAGAAVLLRSDGSASLVRPSGATIEAEAAGLARRGPLTVLALRVAGRRAHWLFLPDTLSDDAARHLRLWFDRHRPTPELPPMVPHV